LDETRSEPTPRERRFFSCCLLSGFFGALEDFVCVIPESLAGTSDEGLPPLRFFFVFFRGFLYLLYCLEPLFSSSWVTGVTRDLLSFLPCGCDLSFLSFFQFSPDRISLSFLKTPFLDYIFLKTP